VSEILHVIDALDYCATKFDDDNRWNFPIGHLGIDPKNEAHLLYSDLVDVLVPELVHRGPVVDEPPHEGYREIDLQMRRLRRVTRDPIVNLQHQSDAGEE